MLHDIGLTDPFDSHRVPFEVAGGDLAWTFGVAAGWPPNRAARASEILARHMREDVSADAIGVRRITGRTGLGISEATGGNPAESRAEILRPRQFGGEFLARFQDQAGHPVPLPDRSRTTWRAESRATRSTAEAHHVPGREPGGSRDLGGPAHGTPVTAVRLNDHMG